MSQIINLLGTGTGGPVMTLTGNSGGAVGPDGGGNINVIGTGSITVTDNPGTHTLTIADSYSGLTFDGDSGTATPSAGVITMAGGHNITTSAAVHTVTYNVSGTTNHSLLLGNATGSINNLGVATSGYLPIGSTGADPVLAPLTAGANITITNGAGSITIAANSGSETVAYTGVNHAASPYTVLAADYYISADVTAGVISILLPNAPATGRTFIVKDKVGLAATSNITVTTVGGAVNIDGATTFVMNTAYQSCELIFNGTSYEIF